jgi:EAL domain-containing protein (putative c-di-GMP-specific phosphodiesterase class I)
VAGIVRAVTVTVGDTVFEGHPLLFIEEAEDARGSMVAEQKIDLDLIRPDLAEVLARQEKARDAARPNAVARRRKTGQRTARENIAALVDTARTLHISVVGEGIETSTQEQVLLSLGCTLGQGYYYYAPLEPDEVAGVVAVAPQRTNTTG